MSLLKAVYFVVLLISALGSAHLGHKYIAVFIGLGAGLFLDMLLEEWLRLPSEAKKAEK